MQNKDVWLFPQNSCSMDQFFITLNVFGKLNGISRKDNIQHLLMEQQSKKGFYNPYIEKDHYDLSSANHKIDEPRFYGAIYETPNRKIHVSTYGELLLKYENDKCKRNKVFIGMLFNLQFDNPYKKMKNLNIYPLRLIFKLLTEKRLNYYITNVETSYILYFVKKMKSQQDYDNLVNEIILFRNLNNEEKNKRLEENALQFIKNYVSCNYLFNMLSDMEITKQQKEKYNIKVKSPVRKNPTPVTRRKLVLNSMFIHFVEKYLEEVSLFDDIKFPTGLRSDWIRDIYNSVPEILLNEINEKDDMYTEYLQIPALLVESSINPEKWSLFEEYITKSFNLFVDVKAETIGGPGQPDSLCHYLKDDLLFCADGKSTHKKLSGINDGRLKQHRNLYNAQYTIVVTPGYVPSAVEDIKNTKTCIITSYCFADLITKYIFKLYKNKEECSYSIFNDLIMSNLGTDLSEKIYKIIDDKLGVSIDLI